MMRRLPRIVAGLWLACAAGAAGSAARAQGLEGAEDRPRFLVVALAGKPPEDASDAPVLRRRVTAALDRVPLGDALREIGRQAGVRFAMSPEVVPLERRVSLRASEITLGAALFELLAGLRLDVQFARDGRGAAIVPRRSSGATSAEGGVTGRVTDAATGKELGGVEVVLGGARWRAMTDTSGRYRLAEVAAGEYDLTTRRPGYRRQSRKVTVRAGRVDTVDVALVPAPVTLDELVTTATGQQRRRDIGNAITTIRADSVLQSAPIRDLSDLLENRVPGMTAQRTSGAPGDPTRLRFRGIGSVMRSNDPVVIVDGVRLYAAQSEARSGNLTNLAGVTPPPGRPFTTSDRPAPSPLDQIDPNIIEKVEVFKGPSAATLYGADAANGVIVITTKKGKPGPTTWNASVTRSRTALPGRWPEGYFRWGRSSVTGMGPMFCTILTIECAQDSLVRYQALNDPGISVLGKGHRTALSLTASGGSQALTYRVTGTYDDELGLLRLPAYEVERFRGRFNRDAPDWMRRPHNLRKWSVSSGVQARLGATADVTLGTTLSRTEQQRSSLEYQLARIAGTYFDRVNGVYYTSGVVGGSQWTLGDSNQVLRDYYERTTASSIGFTTSLNANWRPRAWLTLSGQAGLDVMPRSDESLLPAGLVSSGDSGTAIRATGRSLVSTFNLLGDLRKPLGLGFVFKTSAGVNLTTTNTSDLATAAFGLVPGTSSLSGASRFQATDGQARSSVFGWYVEPSIMGERLSLSTGLRLDGGSTYGTRVTNLLALPKLNASWTISEEPFFPFKSLFSSLRLRGAYGQAQVQPGPTDRLRLYNPEISLVTIGNTALRPERSAEFEGGFDADLFGGRFSIEATAYHRKKIDALMAVTLPHSVNGGGTVLKNIGTIVNTGLELTTTVVPVQRPALTWRVQMAYSGNRNELTELGDGVLENPGEGIVAGYPVGSRWARPILGVIDQNGNGVAEADEIRVGDTPMFLGRLLPSDQLGIHSDLALFGGALGVSASFAYETGASQLDRSTRETWVLERALVDPTAPLLSQASIVALRSLGTEYGAIRDVSTFRFSTLSVNYRAPAAVARLLRADRMSVALQGSNLGLHSNYRGVDPNVNTWGTGEAISDTGQLPEPRTWQVAVFLQY